MENQKQMRPVICYQRSDPFKGMGLVDVEVRELLPWKSARLSTSFFLHQVVGYPELFTVSHLSSGLDVLGRWRWADSKVESKRRALGLIKKMEELIAYAEWNYCHGILYTPIQMVKGSHNYNQYKDWEQKKLLSNSERKLVREQMRRIK